MTTWASHDDTIGWRAFIRAALLVCACLCVSACPERRDHDPDTWFPPSKVKYSDGFEAVKAAADSGDPQAMYILATYDSVAEKGGLTHEHRRRYLIEAADRKHRNAQERVFHGFRHGYSYFAKSPSSAIYWAKRIACDNSVESNVDMYLSELFGSGIGFVRLTTEERQYVTTNLPYAYAHLRLAGVTGGAFLDKVIPRMTPDDIRKGDTIVELFRNGGCPYDDLGKS